MSEFFKKGHHVGRPRGSRNRLASHVLDDALAIWGEPAVDGSTQTKGQAALRNLFKTRPAEFAKWFASLMPREITHENIVNELSDEELAMAIREWRERRDLLQQQEDEAPSVIVKTQH